MNSLARILSKMEFLGTITKLGISRNHLDKSVSNALRVISHGRLTAEEGVWIESIESSRSELDGSVRQITVVDYGAGSPTLQIRAEVMNEGRIFKTTVGEICRTASITKKWGKILLLLVREFSPQSCLELGTCLGISSAYQAAALKSLSGRRILVSLEGDPTLATLAGRNFERIGLDNIIQKVGRFHDLLENTLVEFKPNFVFIDGQHDKEAVLSLVDTICESLQDGSVLVLDDITWSEGMRIAWREITLDARFGVCVDLGRFGMSVIDHRLKKQRQVYKISL